MLHIKNLISLDDKPSKIERILEGVPDAGRIIDVMIRERAFRWEIEARPAQIPPDNWKNWLILYERGCRIERVVNQTILHSGAKKVSIIVPRPIHYYAYMTSIPSSLAFLGCSYKINSRRAVYRDTVVDIHNSIEMNGIRGARYDLLVCCDLADWETPENYEIARVQTETGARVIVTSSLRSNYKILNDIASSEYFQTTILRS